MRHLLLEEEAGQVGPDDHVEADGLGEDTRGDGDEQHERESLAPFRAEGERESRIHEATEQDGHPEEGRDLCGRDGDVDWFEGPARQHADDEPEKDEGEQVVDHATRHDHAGQARVGQPQVFERLEGDYHCRGGHGETDEDRAHRIHPKGGRDAEADTERNDRTHHGYAEGAFEGVEELQRLGLDPRVEHEEEDPDLCKESERRAGLDEAQNGGPHHDPDDELTHDGGKSQGPQRDRHQPNASQEDQ